MAFAQIEDFNGKMELVFFPKVWQTYKHLVATDRILGFTGKIDTSKGEPKFLVDTVVEPEELKQSGVTQIHIKIIKQVCTTENLNRLRDHCLDNTGNCRVFLHITNESDEEETIVKASGQLNVEFSDNFIDIVKENPMVTDVWYL